MKTCSLSTYSWNNVSALILRLTLGVVMWPHGAQKVLGWFGGNGFSGTYHYFVDMLGIWAPLTILAILTEFITPLLIVVGLLTRLSAFAIMVMMLVAMRYNVANGFFMNWTGKQAGEGIEYQILYCGAALALVFLGAGKYSLDNNIFGFCRRCKKQEMDIALEDDIFSHGK